MPPKNPPNTVSEFLDRTGTIPILLEIGTGAKRYSEIEDAVSVSSATLSERLNDGMAIGVWKKEISTHEEEFPTRYLLTMKGERIMEKMQELDLPHHIVKLRTYRAEVETRSKELRKWATELDAT